MSVKSARIIGLSSNEREKKGKSIQNGMMYNRSLFIYIQGSLKNVVHCLKKINETIYLRLIKF